MQKIEAEHFDDENARIVFPPKQSKGKKYHRVIYLTGRAKEIVRRLADASPEGPILLNSKGGPWNKNAIKCAFCRLQLALGRRKIEERKALKPRPSRFKKSGVDSGQQESARDAHRAIVKAWQEEEVNLARELGTKYHLGAFRKGFATEALKSGVDTVSLAHLLGHRDPSMVSKVYGQVQNDPKHMARMAERAKGKG